MLPDERPLRIGLFGGTFDPIHLGHLVLAEQCREQLALDEVWFIPAGTPPHKPADGRTPGPNRLDMVQLAIAGHAPFHVTDLELQRSGPSFTVETLAEVRRLRPQARLWWLLGADMLHDFSNWREPERIVTMARLGAVNRGGVVTGFPDQWAAHVDAVTIPALAIAASDLRERIAQKRSIRYLVPRAVEEYLREHGLYQKR